MGAVVVLLAGAGCDGSVFVNANGTAGLSYSTTSERLARDVQHLLLRFGIVVRLRTKISRYKNEPYTSYELVSMGTAPVRDFLAQIGIALARLDAGQLSQQLLTAPQGACARPHQLVARESEEIDAKFLYIDGAIGTSAQIDSTP